MTVSITVLLLIGVAVATDVTPSLPIRIGVLLPRNGTYPFTERYIMPAASLALDHVRYYGLLNTSYALSISSRDTKCDEGNGMNEAIIYHIEGSLSAFFGPICDYVAAPVARQMAFWNRPMLSIGAMAREFKDRKQEVFTMLTRTGTTNLNTLAYAVKQALMEEYHWSNLKLLYDRTAFGDINPDFCHLATDSLVNSRLNLTAKIMVDYYRLTKATLSEAELRRLLVDEVGNKYAGKSPIVRAVAGAVRETSAPFINSINYVTQE